MIVSCWNKLYLTPFARYSASKISISDLDPSRSPKIKYISFVGKSRGDIIKAFCWYELSISYRLRHILHLRFRLVTLTFQGHQRSNISCFLESSYATLWWCSVDTNSISYRLRDIPLLRFQFVTWTFQGHQRSNMSTFLESPYATL